MYSSGNKIRKILDTLANSTSPPSLPCSAARVVEGEDGKILAAILKVLFALLRSPHSRLRKEGG